MYHLGLDPGKTNGGYALIDDTGKLIVTGKFSSFRQFRDDILKPYRKGIVSCAIEKVASKTKQGVKSVFTFGANYGGYLSLLEVFNIPHKLIPPTRWQPMLLGTFPKGQSKKRSVEFINRRYPHVKLKEKDDGISDAVCLALYSAADYRRFHGRVRSSI